MRDSNNLEDADARAQGASLTKYDEACRAVAAARTVDEAKAIRDQAVAMQCYARQAKNRDLEADAVEIRMRATRRLDQLRQAQAETVGLNVGAAGGGKKAGPRGSFSNPRDTRPTLASQGIDKNLAHSARVLGGLSDSDFEHRIAEARAAAARICRRVVRGVEIEQARERHREQTAQGGKVADLAALAASGYRAAVIYADPPWPWETWGGESGKIQTAPDNHYSTMTLAEIKAFGARYVTPLAAKNCMLLLWTTWPLIALGTDVGDVIRAWGFEPKTAGFIWIKNNPSGEGLHWGGGYWTRSNSEPCLLATRGAPTRLAADVHQVITAPVGAHSEKPSEAHDRIERLVAGPYLELFARRPRAGWTTWGDELPPLRAPADDIGPDSAGEIARLAARSEELGREARRTALRQAAAARLAAAEASDDGDIPGFPAAHGGGAMTLAVAGIFADWQRMLAAVRAGETRLKIFHEAARDIGRHVGADLDRAGAVDKLLDIATAHGWFGITESEVERIIGDEIERAADERAIEAKTNGAHARKPHGLLLSYDEMVKLKPPTWLVEGVLPRGAAAVLFGESNAFKSFIAVDLACSVVFLSAWHGHAVKPGNVIYVASESGFGVATKRIPAWMAHHKIPAAQRRGIFLRTAPPLLDDRQSLAAFKAEIASVAPVALIVYDVLAGTMKGSEKDTDIIAAWVRVVGDIEATFGCGQLFITHSPYGDAGRIRGGTHLWGSFDTRLKAEGDRENRTTVLSVERHKDYDSVGLRWGFKLDIAGIDEFPGQSSLVLVEDEAVAAQAKSGKLTGTAAAALHAFKYAIAEGAGRTVTSEHVPVGVDTLSVELWRHYHDKLSPSQGTADARRKRFDRGTERLLALRLVAKWDADWWLTNQGKAVPS